jgi:hypothetical protein
MEVGVVRPGGKNLVLLLCFLYCGSLAVARKHFCFIGQYKKLLGNGFNDSPEVRW